MSHKAEPVKKLFQHLTMVIKIYHVHQRYVRELKRAIIICATSPAYVINFTEIPFMILRNTVSLATVYWLYQLFYHNGNLAISL